MLPLQGLEAGAEPTLKKVRAALAEVADYRADGDLEAARERLLDLLAGPRFEALAALTFDEAQAELEALNTCATELSLLGAGRAVQGTLLALAEADLPAGDLRIEIGRFMLAGTLQSLGELAESIELFERALAGFEAQLEQDDPFVLKTKQNLATSLKEAGRLPAALELEEQVLALRRETLPADHPELLAIELNLGGTRYQLGDLTGAHESFEHVHGICERQFPPGNELLLAAQQALALTLGDQGDHAGACELKATVLRAYVESRPAGHPDVLIAQSNLAISLDALGRYPGALELREAVHAGWSEVLPSDHPELLRAKQNLAISRGKNGDSAGALELDEEVLTRRRELLPPGHQDLVRAIFNLGIRRNSSGDVEGALELFQEAHEIWSERLAPTHPDALRAAIGVAGALQGLGRTAAAVAVVEEVLAAQLELLEELGTYAPRVARAIAESELERLSAALNADVAAGLTPELADRLDAGIFEVLEGLRSLSTSSASIARALAGRVELQDLRAQLARVRGQLNDTALAVPVEAARREAWRAEVVALARERDQIERELRSRLGELGVTPAIARVEEVASQLDDDALLVSFFRHRGHFRFTDPATGAGEVGDVLLALVVAPGGQVRCIELGPSGELEGLVEAWRVSLGCPTGARGGRGVVIESDVTADNELELGAELRRRLLEPCRTALGNDTTATLCVIPDDFLHLIPFDALPLDDGGRLGDRLAVRTEMSAAGLVAAVPLSGDPASGQLLAIGGIDYDAQLASDSEDAEDSESGATDADARGTSDVPDDPGQRSPLAGHWAGLSGALDEVRALGERFEQTFGQPAIVLTGSAATKSALAGEAPRARWLHIATHGWFAPESSRPDWNAAGQPGASSALIRFASDTLCGLALAGANRASAGAMRGILTAEELAALDLSRCELAVLSACETNVGLHSPGQGVRSLQVALHAAGARTAITSLWKVDDRATQRLMSLYYEAAWSDGLSKAEALWSAKQKLRDEGRPVRDWAGWVLTGDPD